MGGLTCHCHNYLPFPQKPSDRPSAGLEEHRGWFKQHNMHLNSSWIPLPTLEFEVSKHWITRYSWLCASWSPLAELLHSAILTKINYCIHWKFFWWCQGCKMIYWDCCWQFCRRVKGSWFIGLALSGSLFWFSSVALIFSLSSTDCSPQMKFRFFSFEVTLKDPDITLWLSLSH